MNNQQGYALITGATSGIGLELAKLFAKDQYNLVLVARTEEDLHSTAAILSANGIDVRTIAKDLFRPEGAQELYDEVKNMGISIDILVNDAGQGYYGEFKDTELQRELDIIQLNISSLVSLTKLYLRDMLANGGGRILNLSSIASKAPGPYHSVYHGTKAFVQSFTSAIQYELKDSPVSVTALLPGATDTDFFNKADMNDSKIVQKGDLDDAGKVAKDGYEALMSDDQKVISGFKNKTSVALSNASPDAMAAASMAKQQEPVNK